MVAFDDNSIKQFITDSFSFRRDHEFHLLEISDRIHQRISLAASGGGLDKSNLERCGVLSNQDESILLRVFQDRNSHDYWLFLLGNGNYKFEGALLSTAKGLQYFLIQADQKVHIPSDLSVNPIEETLYLTFPDDSASIDAEMLHPSGTIAIESASGQSMEITFEHQPDSESGTPGNSLVIQNVSGPIHPTKLLYFQPSFTRMVPMFKNKAVIQLSQEIIEGSVNLYLYE